MGLLKEIRLASFSFNLSTRSQQRDADGELQQADLNRPTGLPRPDEAACRVRSGPRNPGRNPENPEPSNRFHHQVVVERAAVKVPAGPESNPAPPECPPRRRPWKNWSSGETPTSSISTRFLDKSSSLPVCRNCLSVCHGGIRTHHRVFRIGAICP